MFDEVEAASRRELQWLAQYYEKHGMHKEAKEIRDTLAEHETRNMRSANVIQMFPDEEKEA